MYQEISGPGSFSRQTVVEYVDYRANRLITAGDNGKTFVVNDVAIYLPGNPEYWTYFQVEIICKMYAGCQICDVDTRTSLLTMKMGEHVHATVYYNPDRDLAWNESRWNWYFSSPGGGGGEVEEVKTPIAYKNAWGNISADTNEKTIYLNTSGNTPVTFYLSDPSEVGYSESRKSLYNAGTALATISGTFGTESPIDIYPKGSVDVIWEGTKWIIV